MDEQQLAKEEDTGAQEVGPTTVEEEPEPEFYSGRLDEDLDIVQAHACLLMPSFFTIDIENKMKFKEMDTWLAKYNEYVELDLKPKSLFGKELLTWWRAWKNIEERTLLDYSARNVNLSLFFVISSFMKIHLLGTY